MLNFFPPCRPVPPPFFSLVGTQEQYLIFIAAQTDLLPFQGMLQNCQALLTTIEPGVGQVAERANG
jgi:hypothetical protein